MSEIKEPWVMARVLTEDYAIQLFDMVRLAASEHGCGDPQHESGIVRAKEALARGHPYLVCVYTGIIQQRSSCPFSVELAARTRSGVPFTDYDSAFAAFRGQELKMYELHREEVVA